MRQLVLTCLLALAPAGCGGGETFDDPIPPDSPVLGKWTGRYLQTRMHSDDPTDQVTVSTTLQLMADGSFTDFDGDTMTEHGTFGLKMNGNAGTILLQYRLIDHKFDIRLDGDTLHRTNHRLEEKGRPAKVKGGQIRDHTLQRAR